MCKMGNKCAIYFKSDIDPQKLVTTELWDSVLHTAGEHKHYALGKVWADPK